MNLADSKVSNHLVPSHSTFCFASLNICELEGLQQAIGSATPEETRRKSGRTLVATGIPEKIQAIGDFAIFCRQARIAQQQMKVAKFIKKAMVISMEDQVSYCNRTIQVGPHVLVVACATLDASGESSKGRDCFLGIYRCGIFWLALLPPRGVCQPCERGHVSMQSALLRTLRVCRTKSVLSWVVEAPGEHDKIGNHSECALTSLRALTVFVPA